MKLDLLEKRPDGKFDLFNYAVGQHFYGAISDVARFLGVLVQSVGGGPLEAFLRFKNCFAKTLLHTT